jgi:hypothetical protein
MNRYDRDGQDATQYTHATSYFEIIGRRPSVPSSHMTGAQNNRNAVIVCVWLQTGQLQKKAPAAT